MRLLHCRRYWAWLCGLAVLVPGCSSPGAGEDRPRVVLITIDTLRADHLGCYGSAIQTPALDGLAAEGVRFAQCFTGVPTTSASHAAMLTGLDARRLGVARNGYALSPDARTAAEIAQAAGLRTAAFISSFALAPQFGLDQGFELYDATYTHTEALDQDWRSAEETSTAVIAWLRGIGDEAFFLWIHYFDPHFPYDPPPPFATLYDADYDGSLDGSMETIFGIWRGEVTLTERDARHLRALYAGEVSYTDAQLARVLAELRDLGRMNDTWIVATADHGESLGEHNYWFDHGKNLYDTDLRVPLIIRPPDNRQELPRSIAPEALVRTLDLAPTLIEIFGEQPERTLQGRTLLPLVSGKDESSTRTLFAEATKPHHVESRQGWPNERKSHALRGENWKLIETPYLGRRELYDLRIDPGEAHSLSGSGATPQEGLEQELKSWLDRAPRPPIRPDPRALKRLESLGYLD